jgi:phosphopantothenoylcysteine decarboxylase/phosphopantothenate--cysteine ligase
VGDDKRTVLLCVTGSISVYKAADIARELMRAGCEVHVALTEAARHFVTAELFTWLTRQPAVHDMFVEPEPGKMAHIELAHKADLMLCAPASAQTIAKFALGLADDLVGALHLAYQGPLVVAPAMNPAMWAHSAVQANIATLRQRGVRVVEPVEGEVACGDEGVGKLAPVEDVVREALAALARKDSLRGVRVLVTSGPTYEPIDPVRFIGNRSSGKMGHAVAQEALNRGAEVTLVTGPTALPVPAGIDVTRVRTAAEMAEACREAFENCDIFVGAAAVADFRPVSASAQKIKRGDKALQLALEPTEDVIASLAAAKRKQVVVGFAAESGDVVANARGKLERKKLDLVVANDITEPGSGFESDRSRVTLVFKDGRTEELPLLPKSEVAARLLDVIEAELLVLRS